MHRQAAVRRSGCSDCCTATTAGGTWLTPCCCRADRVSLTNRSLRVTNYCCWGAPMAPRVLRVLGKEEARVLLARLRALPRRGSKCHFV